MPRPLRGQTADHPYHIINHAQGGAIVFHKNGDYHAFLEILAVAQTKYSMKVFGFCLMPNHFHVLLQPVKDNTLSSFMQWWQTCHAVRHHLHFKSFPVQQDGHFLTVLRYVLRNSVRAGLVEKTAHWPWSSLHHPHLIAPCPMVMPADWTRWIDEPLFDHELIHLRTCVNRQLPFGSSPWQPVWPPFPRSRGSDP